MKLKRRSKLVRWAYFLSDSQEQYTSLCVFFWRVMLLTPIKLAGIGFLISVIAIAFFQAGRYAVIYWGITFPVLGALLFVAYIIHIRKLSVRERKAPSLLNEYIKAKKQKVCPVIEFE